MKALVRITPDITTKADATRRRFTKIVGTNLRRALKRAGFEADVRWTLARLYVDYQDPLVLPVVCRTFGVHSVSPCRAEPLTDLDGLVARGAELMTPRVRGRSFAVRGRVRDATAGFRSQDINDQLGAALSLYGRVNLSDPEVTVRVEVREGVVWFFDQVIPGEGGLPVGSGGRAVVLLSGGFDSAVAAYEMMKRGVALDYVCMELGGESHTNAVIAVANALVREFGPGSRSRLVTVPFEETVERLRADVSQRFWQLVLKRLMYRVAEGVAAETGADAIVTGEAIGQVSSQTLPNLRALEARAGLPVLRPLLTWDKQRIVDRARHVGTHDLCARVPEYCALAARKPATRARVEQVAEAEDAMTFEAVDALARAAWHDLPTGLVAGEPVTIDAPPEGAMLLDLRSPPARRARPIPGAVGVSAVDLLERPEAWDTNTSYVVICDAGQRSVWFARRMRDLGFRAWALDR